MLTLIRFVLSTFVDTISYSTFYFISLILGYSSISNIRRRSNTALIIGNGSSLTKDKLNAFLDVHDDVDVYASNRAYLFLQEWNIDVHCYCFEDKLVINNFEREITNVLPDSQQIAISVSKLSWSLFNLRWRKRRRSTFSFAMAYAYFGFPCFKPNFFNILPFYNGCTVTYFILQLVHCLRYQKVYFLGVDNNYEVDSHNGSYWSSTSTNVKNHTVSNYLGNYDWNTPKPDKMNIAYLHAFSVFKKSGIYTLNLEPTSKLPGFPLTDA